LVTIQHCIYNALNTQSLLLRQLKLVLHCQNWRGTHILRESTRSLGPPLATALSLSRNEIGIIVHPCIVLYCIVLYCIVLISDCWVRTEEASSLRGCMRLCTEYRKKGCISPDYDPESKRGQLLKFTITPATKTEFQSIHLTLIPEC